MKKIFNVILIIMLVMGLFLLSGCGDREKNNPSNQVENGESSVSINQDKIVGEWQIKQIITDGEERSFSSYYGLEIAEKYHFEFYSNGRYVKLLGELDEKGTYEIVGNKVNMTSESNNLTVAEFTKDEDGNEVLVESNDGGTTGTQIYYEKADRQ